MRKLLLLTLIFSQLTFINATQALPLTAVDTTKADSKPTEAAKDEFGRETPKSMITNFLESLAKQDYKKALNYMDLSGLPRNQQRAGENLAAQFHTLLDENGWMLALNKLSNDPNGNIDDDLPPNTEKVGAFKTSKQTIPITADKHQPTTTDAAPYWQITSETLRQLPTVQAETRKSILNQYLPEPLITTIVFGVPVGHWIALLAIIAGSYTVVWIVSVPLIRALYKLLHKFRKNDSDEEIRTIIANPLQLFIAIVVAYICVNALGFTVLAKQAFSQLAQALIWVSIVWAVWNMIDVITGGIKRKLLESKHSEGVSVIIFLRRGIKFMLLFILFITVLDNFGFQITTWIAALGIGGIAIALGTQKTVENFVGSLTLVADRPVAIGDLCRFGNNIGHVEDIGMRSTRIRTLDRTIITVPNGEFSSTQIENLSKRDKFRFKQIINIGYGATKEQLIEVIEKYRAILKENAKIIAGSEKVNLSEITANSINIEVVAQIRTTDSAEADNVKEEICLKLIDTINKMSLNFSAPSQRMYITNIPESDPRK
jgi:MscS family membrane protein